jgi:hypothetical protein
VVGGFTTFLLIAYSIQKFWEMLGFLKIYGAKSCLP